MMHGKVTRTYEIREEEVATFVRSVFSLSPKEGEKSGLCLQSSVFCFWNRQGQGQMPGWGISPYD